jgi:hypothetical protein
MIVMNEKRAGAARVNESRGSKANKKELSIEHQQEINTHGAANKTPRL